SIGGAVVRWPPPHIRRKPPQACRANATEIGHRVIWAGISKEASSGASSGMFLHPIAAAKCAKVFLHRCPALLLPLSGGPRSRRFLSAQTSGWPRLIPSNRRG